jgi:hypothetical protein
LAWRLLDCESIDIKNVGVGIQLAQELNCPVVLYQLADVTIWIVQIAENSGLLVAGSNTVRQLSLFEPIFAEVTFADSSGFVIVLPGSIGAGHDAGKTTYTFRIHNVDDSVIALYRSGGWADVNTWRVVAVHTNQRQKAQGQVRKSSCRTDGGYRVVDDVDW